MRIGIKTMPIQNTSQFSYFFFQIIYSFFFIDIGTVRRNKGHIKKSKRRLPVIPNFIHIDFLQVVKLLS